MFCVFVDGCTYKPTLALNCRLQIEHVNSDSAESDDGPLALTFLSKYTLIYQQQLTIEH